MFYNPATVSHVLFSLVCLIWGCSFILMKKAGLWFSDPQIAALRTAGGAAGLALMWMLARRAWPLCWRDAVRLLPVAVLGFAAPFWLQPWIVRLSSSAFTGMLVSLVPLLTIAVSVPMLGVRPTGRQALGVLGGLAAMVVLFGDQLRVTPAPGVLLLGALTPLCYAVSNTWVKRGLSDVSAQATSLAGLTMATLLLLAPALTPPPGQAAGASHATMVWAWVCVIILGVVGTGLGNAMFYSLIRRHGPLYAGMVAYVIPCISLLAGWLDREPMRPAQVAALGVVFAMVALVQSAPGPTPGAVGEGTLTPHGQERDTAAGG